MDSTNPFLRSSSADVIGRSPQRLMRTSSARETGSPDIESATSDSDGGASLGDRLQGMTLGQNLRPSYADPLVDLGTSSRTVSELPMGMTYDDDPFTGLTVPAVYNPYGVQQREQREARRSRYDDNDTVDAQVFYPASSCVFVANLPESMENIKLERELNDKFGVWGAVFVKIRRDKKNMPYAFCQYTNDRDAAAAMANGAGTIFSGRPCRVEKVRANRTFILRNYVGGVVGLDEARQVLQQHGAIGRLEEISRDIADSHGIHQGILVEFKNYDPDRDIQATFRRHAIYRVVAHDPQRSRHAEPVADSEQTYRRRYEVDQRSIFVGNLPDIDGLEREVRLLAGEIGNVVNVQVIRKEGRPGYGMNVFAFVEYARAEVAEMAAQDLAGRRIFGCRIRVERKETRRPGGDESRARTLDLPTRTTIRAASPVRRGLVEPGLYTPRRVENIGNELATSLPSAPAAPMSMPTWFPFGSPNYTTTSFPASGMEGVFPPHPAYLPPSMSWATPYMNDPRVAPQAYWTAFQHAYGAPASATRAPEAGSENDRAPEESHPNDS
ncbi:hypothetical protein PG993_012082 [Apiospora rasikravindrae]|uniref:RRM domain-containing protein n=1 Tax=Apiospora rasikravindrae TaxID=990691 RepID=A0ABR1S1G3_9PEZI